MFWLDETGKGVPALGFRHEYGVTDMEAIVFPGQGKGKCPLPCYVPLGLASDKTL